MAIMRPRISEKLDRRKLKSIFAKTFLKSFSNTWTLSIIVESNRSTESTKIQEMTAYFQRLILAADYKNLDIELFELNFLKLFQLCSAP